MDVSTFELLYKPFTPPLGAGTEALGRRVLQGYFLTVANLDAQGFRFRIVFRITLPNPDNPSRRLDANHKLIIDVGSAPDNQFTTLNRNPPGGNRYAKSFRLDAGRTALLVLLPDVTVPGFFTTGPTDIEIRGHVSLVLPCIKGSPQPGAPAKVLLQAEHRAVFLPNGWPTMATGDLDFDQTNVNLSLASGQALNQVPQAPCANKLAASLRMADMTEALDAMEDAADGPGAAAAAIAALMQIEPDKDSLGTLSRLLGEAGVPIRLEPAKPASR